MYIYSDITTYVCNSGWELFMEDTNSAFIVAYVAMSLWGCLVGLFLGWLIWG